MGAFAPERKKRNHSTSLEVAKRIRRLHELTGGNPFRIRDLLPEDLGYSTNKKSQLHNFCDRLTRNRPDLLYREDRWDVIYYIWRSTPSTIHPDETAPSTDSADQIRALGAQVEFLTGQVSTLSARVEELDALEDLFLQEKAAQVASTLARLSPIQQEYVLRLAADLAAGKK